MTLERLLGRAAPLLGPLDLLDDLTFSGRARVARVRLGDGSTAIVKAPSSPEALAAEVEALRTLPAPVRPALLAADDQVVAMEDLGRGPALADLLLGHDPVAAERGLLGWSQGLGGALRATMRDGPEREPDSLAEGMREMRSLAENLGVSVPRHVDEDVDRVVAVLARPGPWSAFCPGDTCPDNNRILADGSVRFFDFEGAGWRHAAMEAAYCRAPFCTCWCVAALPAGMTGRMEQAFLDALAPPDREGFVEVVGLAVTSYTLASFGWFRRFVLEDRPVGPPDRTPCRGRQYVHARLLGVGGQIDRIPALAALAGDLADRIARRWPNAARMPLYPAFR